MRVFVAGGTGVIGSPLVERLVAGGHDVAASSRSRGGARTITEQGANGVVLDALDADAVRRAVVEFGPDVVMHQSTAIDSIDPKRLDECFAATNALRTTGTDNLVAAARAAGAGRVIAQSFTGWTNQRGAARARTEDEPFDRDPDPAASESLAAIEHLERVVTGTPSLDGVVVRYGNLYGPRTSFDSGGDNHRAVIERQFPIVAGGRGVWSFVHVDDAVEATVLAMTGPPGVYNVVDDEPAAVREWLPDYAATIGAKPPRKAPGWIAKRMIGSHGLRLMTDISGSSNERAKAQLGWSLEHPTWRGHLGPRPV
jgi:nucleoside-diphosphate-sugar epimerase